MSVIYCHRCDRYIDTDYDTDHEYQCKLDHGIESEDVVNGGA